MISPRIKLYRPRGLNPVVDQREELPLLPFGNPIGFVPASGGGVYIDSNLRAAYLDNLRYASYINANI